MHFVTYRLVGTIPESILANLRAERLQRLNRNPQGGLSVRQHRERVHKQFFFDYDRYLDRTCPIDWLARPPIAALIRGSLYHHRGSRWHLLAYCVMPNHVHVVLQPIEGDPQARRLGAATGLQARTPAATDQDCSDETDDARSPLASIMHNLKGYTAHEANRLLGCSGQFWQHESYDHWVRDDDELERIVEYIVWNPVKAKLVREPHEWFFGSAHDRFLQDGSKAGFLAG
jgi:putative DNA methylase